MNTDQAGPTSGTRGVRWHCLHRLTRVRQFIAAALLLQLGACGGGGSGGDPPPPTDLPPALQLRINRAVESIRSDSCFLLEDSSACTWADYGITPGHFAMDESTGEAVLVVDDFGEGALPQLLRYRNRLLGLYRVDGHAVELQPASARLPKALGDALLSFAGPSFTPARSLTQVGQAAAQTYQKVPLLFLGHGGVVLSHLVELTPQQPLVLLQLNGLLGLRPGLCDLSNRGAIAAAQLHFSEVAASLRQLMRVHKVRFVNASFGDSVRTLSLDWSRTCGTPPPERQVLRELLGLYAPVYDALFSTPGVLAAASATELGDALD